VIEETYLLSFFVFSAFLWGAIWGSFLNVVIWRLPRGESLAKPDSRCPKCETPIRWFDNIPVVSWIALRAKCRACKAPISARYPGVELLISLLSAALMWHVAHGRLDGDTIGPVLMVFVLHFYFVLILVAIAFIDLDLTIIPHKLSMPLIAWGIFTAFRLPKDGIWAEYFPLIDQWTARLGLRPALACSSLSLAPTNSFVASTGEAVATCGCWGRLARTSAGSLCSSC
jgi:prepilin signal peptidase PulO-like enzyme (type II secretory pathway)